MPISNKIGISKANKNCVESSTATFICKSNQFNAIIFLVSAIKKNILKHSFRDMEKKRRGKSANLDRTRPFPRFGVKRDGLYFDIVGSRQLHDVTIVVVLESFGRNAVGHDKLLVVGFGYLDVVADDHGVRILRWLP